MRPRAILVSFFPVLAFAFAVVGCRGGGPSTLEVKPREVTAAERAQAVSHLPAGFKQGLPGSEAEVAEQLGLRAWAFEFSGGPFGCWIDIAEDGQRTAQSPHARNPGTRISCDAESGVLLFWLQPRTTPQMSQRLKDRFLRDDPQVPNLFVGLAVNERAVLELAEYDIPDKLVVPLWFGWKDAEVREQAHAATLKPGEDAAILVVEATEKGAEGRPRGAKLTLTAVK